MLKKRWYDHDPMLSMAVSLLQNASKADQGKTVKYIFSLLEQDHVLQEYRAEIKDPLKISHIFPFKKRQKLEDASWRLLEILKHLPASTQLEVALNMINYIYLLEAGITLQEEELEPTRQSEVR